MWFLISFGVLFIFELINYFKTRNKILNLKIENNFSYWLSKNERLARTNDFICFYSDGNHSYYSIFKEGQGLFHEYWDIYKGPAGGAQPSIRMKKYELFANKIFSFGEYIRSY